MTGDPIQRLQAAFSQMLERFREAHNWTVEQMAAAAGLSAEDAARLGQGERGPTLSEFLRIADAFGQPPAILFTDLVAACRADSTEGELYKSRPSEFSRLYRLGWHETLGDFREYQGTYDTVDEATCAARKLNSERHRRALHLLDTVTIYIRMGFTRFAWNPEDAA